MAICITCTLHPYGFAAKPIQLATLTIVTTDDLKHHAFSVGSIAGCKKSVRLVLPKTKSAHRNILHVLRDFLSAADLDALGTDYITTTVDRGGMR